VNGNEIDTARNPVGGAWLRQTVNADHLNAVTCPSASLCLAVGSRGALYVSTDPASGSWTGTTIDDFRELTWISCPSPSLCVATDSTGHVVTSTDPTAGPSAWAPTLIDGDPCTDTTPCSVEKIQAADATGLHTVDSSKLAGAGPFLRGLTLTGDVLSWSHQGTPRSTTLERP
jgi:hypothetical protein